MFDAEFKTRMLNAGKRPCRCGRMMPEYLTICFDCQHDEAEAALHQESIDLAAECESYADEMDWREADRLDLADTQASVMASMRGW